MLRKRLDYGFHGYQVPPVPRAARSARKRGPIIRKKVQDNHMCAFDLLATVAGQLLEGESPPAATTLATKGQGERVDVQENLNGTEEQNEGVLRVGDDKVNPRVSLPVNEIISSVQDQQCKETVNAHGCTSSGLASGVANSASDPSRKFDFEEKVVTESDKNEIKFDRDKIKFGCHSSNLSDSDKIKFGCHSSNLGRSCTSSYEGISCDVPSIAGRNTPVMSSMHVDIGDVSFGTGPDICGPEDPILCSDRKSTPPSSYSNGNVASLCKENCPNAPASLSRDNVNVVSRDDDENFSVCSGPSTKIKRSRSVLRIGNRRVRKLLASRCWRAAPKMKDGDHSDNGVEFRSIYHSRKNVYKRQRSQRIYQLKKRKVFNCISNSRKGIDCDGIYKSAEGETMDMTSSGLDPMWHGAIGESALLAEQNPVSMQSRDSHVKLRIKSFQVPELFIELPETATVGSLKKTVMDAVTAMLGGGLHVGLLLEGKKIKDDSKTLLQYGINYDDEADALAFSLEPDLSQVLQADSSEDHGIVVSSDETRLVLRSPATSMEVHDGTSHRSSDFPVTNLGNNFIDSDHDSAPSPAENSADKSAIDSKALVALPEGNAEPLAAVPPMNKRCKRSDMAQRRMRRPFSIAEVEALVQAVEKLGTGRWRDVKLRAFDNMKHRTYVDLKDKWKTLVHTAGIPPQQRRGEPVPQELLDRVLVAQAYWSKQQAKH